MLSVCLLGGDYMGVSSPGCNPIPANRAGMFVCLHDDFQPGLRFIAIYCIVLRKPRLKSETIALFCFYFSSELCQQNDCTSVLKL